MITCRPLLSLLYHLFPSSFFSWNNFNYFLSSALHSRKDTFPCLKHVLQYSSLEVLCTTLFHTVYQYHTFSYPPSLLLPLLPFDRMQNMDEVKHIFTQLVKCVEHLHSKGVVHGDIKTLNLVRTGTIMCIYIYHAMSFLTSYSILSCPPLSSLLQTLSYFHLSLQFPLLHFSSTPSSVLLFPFLFSSPSSAFLIIPQGPNGS